MPLIGRERHSKIYLSGPVSYRDFRETGPRVLGEGRLEEEGPGNEVAAFSYPDLPRSDSLSFFHFSTKSMRSGTRLAVELSISQGLCDGFLSFFHFLCSSFPKAMRKFIFLLQNNCSSFRLVNSVISIKSESRLGYTGICFES